MPKLINYPNASFSKSLELAEAIDSVGASCSKESAAATLNASPTSGSFSKLVSAAQKYNLISTENGKLTITALYREISLSYNDEEARLNKIKAFLTPPLFENLYLIFKGKKLPITHLDKLVVKEHDVDKNSGSRIAGYFTDGLKMLKLIDENGLVVDYGKNDENIHVKEEKIQEETGVENEFSPYSVEKFDNGSQKKQEEVIEVLSADEFYIVHILGPGMDTKIKIQDEMDIIIVEATLKKVKHKLIVE